MRVFLCYGLGLVISVFAVKSAPMLGQSDSRPNSQQSGLSSSDWSVRRDAYEKIKSNQKALQRSDVRTALLGLLDRENKIIHFPFLNSSGEVIGASGKYGEEYTEYYYELEGTVEKLADWHDPGQICILADASYDPDSEYAERIAVSGGSLAASCLLRRAHGSLLDRRESIPVLLQLSAANNDLSDGIRLQIRQVATEAMRDPDVLLRQLTVKAAGKFGTSDMIPTLQDIAHSDPVSRVKNGQQFYSVREAAAQAIVSIQNRAKAQ